jgi:tRNA (mo5U34)-methyltransferase
MASRTWRFRGLSVSVDLSDNAVRRLRGGSRPSDGDAAAAPGRLVFRDPPAMDIKRRDAGEALAFREVAESKGREAAEQLTADDGDLLEQVRSLTWYHTIELPGGVTTPGQFDHQELLPRYGFPADMTGKRALDVATFNGFWAFHMESLGADVVAIDLDDPREWDFPTPIRPDVDSLGELPPIGRGFEIASKALGSKVQRVGRSVYDLDPDVDGSFDFVHCGDVLVHLRQPLRALEAIRSVTTGQLLLSDGIDVDLPRGAFGPTTQYLGGWDDVVWWVPSLDALAQMVIDAGFRDVTVNCVYNLAKTYETDGFWRVSLTARV